MTTVTGVAITFFAVSMVSITTSLIMIIVSIAINGFLEFLELLKINTFRVITFVHVE